MIRQRNKIRRFILAKSSNATLDSRSKLRYRKNFEIALIISLTAIIFGFRVASNLNVEKLLFHEEKIKFEIVDLLDIQPPIEEPPKMKMEEIIEIPPELEEIEKDNELIEEIEEMLGDNEEKVELALNSNDLGTYLTSNSSIGSISSSDLNFRDRSSFNDGGITLNKDRFYSDLTDNGSIEIDQVERSTRQLASENNSIDLKHEPVNPNATNGTTNKNNYEPKLGLSGLPERILSFSSSTFGTEDYKLWNKINSELDRLNKGRYGATPKEIKRNKSGFLLSFNFEDGSVQEIQWRNNGNVLIKIIGNSNKTSVQELRRTLQSLLKLTLSN